MKTLLSQRGHRLPIEKSKVVLLSLAAAIAYGVVHDEITARVCIEYFTLAHPPLFPVTSPTLVGLCWGVTATFGVGLVLGYLLAQASQSPGPPPMAASSLIRPLAVLLAVTAMAAAIAGSIGFLLSRHSIVLLADLLPFAWVQSLPRSQQDRFMAVWFAHGASYLVGTLGGALLIYRIWARRQRPRLFAIFPRTPMAILRTVMVLTVLGLIVWLRWIRVPE